MGVATLGLRPPPELKRHGIFSEIILKIFSGVMFIIILGSLLFFGSVSRHGLPARAAGTGSQHLQTSSIGLVMGPL